jgi:hypothetical protein
MRRADFCNRLDETSTREPSDSRLEGFRRPSPRGVPLRDDWAALRRRQSQVEA